MELESLPDDKTDWFDRDTPPAHDGIYEWENPEVAFTVPIVPEWRTRHWIVHWNDNFGHVHHTVMADAPCRWRGRLTPPLDVLLEM